MKKQLQIITIAISWVLSLIILADNQHHLLASETRLRENQAPERVEAIARQVTVRLLGDYVAGSGVMIAHQDSTYQVLTCDHVIALDSNEGFKVFTPDGAEYSGNQSDRFDFGDLDLAVVEFTSHQQYPISPWGTPQNLSLMQPIYVAGFPNSHKNSDPLESSLNSGSHAYLISDGLISLLLNKPLEQGYQIGINNEIYIGMSGGPVFNQQGEMVGIIGRTKYGFGGVDAYRFADGSEPDPKLLEQMQSASWAIPISRITRTLKN